MNSSYVSLEFNHAVSCRWLRGPSWPPDVCTCVTSSARDLELQTRTEGSGSESASCYECTEARNRNLLK